LRGTSQNQAGKILSQIKQSPDVQTAFFSPTYLTYKGMISSGNEGSGKHGRKPQERRKKPKKGAGETMIAPGIESRIAIPDKDSKREAASRIQETNSLIPSGSLVNASGKLDLHGEE
jgi:hypothetical protein